MDTQAEKSRHAATGPDEWDGPSKKNSHIHFYFLLSQCTGLTEVLTIGGTFQGKESGEETPPQGHLSKSQPPQRTPSSALSVRRHNADESFRVSRRIFLLIFAFRKEELHQSDGRRAEQGGGAAITAQRRRAATLLNTQNIAPLKCIK